MAEAWRPRSATSCEMWLKPTMSRAASELRFPTFLKALGSRKAKSFRHCETSRSRIPSGNDHPRHQCRVELDARSSLAGYFRLARSAAAHLDLDDVDHDSGNQVRTGRPGRTAGVGRPWAQAFDRLVTEKLENRIATFDTAAAQETATLMGERQRRGLSRDIRDSKIAGIALVRVRRSQRGT